MQAELERWGFGGQKKCVMCRKKLVVRDSVVTYIGMLAGIMQDKVNREERRERRKAELTFLVFW